MTNAAGKRDEQIALMPHSNAITALARSIKAVLDTDVIVVDKYLNRIVNTFQYRGRAPADIRINSVVGSIITTQTLQMIYDRQYFADCVNCPDFMTCELGGVFGTPIMCNDECIGAIALLVDTRKLVSFQKKHKSFVEFLQQIAVLISQMVQNAHNQQSAQSARVKLKEILGSVSEIIAVTDLSGILVFGNLGFWEFFSEGKDMAGSRIEEIIAHMKVSGVVKGDPDSADRSFYRKDQEMLCLREVRDLEDGNGSTILVYIFDEIDAAGFIHSYAGAARARELLDDFFGKSSAMEKARQGTMRALSNHLSVLVESGDRSCADELTTLLSLLLGQNYRQVIHINCSESEKLLEVTLLGRGNEGLGVFSFRGENIICLHGVEYLPRYIQDELKELLCAGWKDGRQIRARILAVSYLDLYSQVKQGLFSTSLYNMISRNKISLPPIGLAAEDLRFYFVKGLRDYCQIYHRPPLTVASDAWDALEKRRWDGGIQEIRKAAETICRSLEEDVLREEDVQRLLPVEEVGFNKRGSVEESIEARLRELLKMGMTKEQMAKELGVSRATLYRWLGKFQLLNRS